VIHEGGKGKGSPEKDSGKGKGKAEFEAETPTTIKARMAELFAQAEKLGKPVDKQAYMSLMNALEKLQGVLVK